VRYIVLSIFSSVIVFNLQAQSNQGIKTKNVIKGDVADSSSGQPLEYATISIFKNNEKNPVNGTTSNKNGLFSLEGMQEGKYDIIIEYIGYLPRKFSNINIGKGRITIDLPKIFLIKKNTRLSNIIVGGAPKILENKIDKIVFNAEQDLTSQGGVATDILQKIPEVSVDADGTVELAGSSSIRFLIDGKPSTVFGSNITDVLQSIPASQIKSVEVVTNPGAKYDASGLGGIINIILKKSNKQGVNGNLSMTLGTRVENGSFNFNARKNNFGFNAFTSGNERLEAYTPNKYDRVSNNDSSNTIDHLLQDGGTNYKRHAIQSGIGFDWTIHQKNFLSGSLNYNEFGKSGNGTTSQLQTTVLNDGNGTLVSDIASLNYSNFTDKFHTVDANLYYRRTFDKEDRVLEISANTSFENSISNSGNSQFVLPADSMNYGNMIANPGKENESEFKIDYTEPFSEKVLFGTGAKLSLDDINTNSSVMSYQPVQKFYLYDSSLINNLNYHQTVYAAYAELSFPVGKLFDAKLGGRYERTDYNSVYSASLQVTASGYNTFVPSIFLLKKIGDNQILKLSYSGRIERPDYDDLNPFINTSDPKNITSGNPHLMPETAGRYELAYSRDYGKTGSFNLTAFYRINNHDIQNYVFYYPTLLVGDSTYTNVAVSTRENIGSEKNFGLNLYGSMNFTKKLNVRLNTFFFYRHTNNVIDSAANSNSFNYRFDLNANYEFTKSLSVEFFGNFNSVRHEAQGTYPSFTSYTFALRKQFWKGKGSIALTSTNLFNEYLNRKTTLSGPGFSVVNTQRIAFRTSGINFTWKFGRLEFRKAKEHFDTNLNPPPIE
jgi:outer membrane receptor protein involved in Fe transport